MGYAQYVLPDGREAGYGVTATCDAPACGTQIDRGLGYLCGNEPDGWRDPDAPGCGKYFCSDHLRDHDCTDPACGAWSKSGNEQCDRRAGHDGLHIDNRQGQSFAMTEDDDAEATRD